MEKHTDKSGKAFDEHPARPADAKPTYQTPVVMPLGELARGQGQLCSVGNGAHTGGNCLNGTTANNCTTGDGATVNCPAGSSVT